MLNKILFVDDDRLIAELALFLMESNGFEVKHCSSGKEALKVAEKYNPDLILLDMHMPEMNGEQTLSELKKIKSVKKIPVIFLTGSANEDDENKYIEKGAIGVIAKPFNPKKLCQNIQYLWNKA